MSIKWGSAPAPTKASECTHCKDLAFLMPPSDVGAKIAANKVPVNNVQLDDSGSSFGVPRVFTGDKTNSRA